MTTGDQPGETGGAAAAPEEGRPRTNEWLMLRYECQGEGRGVKRRAENYAWPRVHYFGNPAKKEMVDNNTQNLLGQGSPGTEDDDGDVCCGCIACKFFICRLSLNDAYLFVSFLI